MTRPEDPFYPARSRIKDAERLIDKEHAKRLEREAKLEREGRETDRDWPDIDDE